LLLLHVCDDLAVRVFVFRFTDALNTGLLEVVVPSPHYYPNFETLQYTFGDTLERVRQEILKFFICKFLSASLLIACELFFLELCKCYIVS